MIRSFFYAIHRNEAEIQSLNGKSNNRRSHSQGKRSTCRQCGDLKNLFETKLKYQREVESMQEERERLFEEVRVFFAFKKKKKTTKLLKLFEI